MLLANRKSIMWTFLLLFIAIPACAVKPPAITTTSCPQGQDAVAYGGCSVNGKWGTKPYSFSVVTGSLPTGLALSTVSNVGKITGTPTVVGTFGFKIRLTDSQGAPKTYDQQLYIQILGTPVPPSNPVQITTATPLPPGLVASAYTTTVQAQNGASPYTWSLIGGSIPAGLSLAPSTGIISGTPTAPGTSNFTLKATDSAANPSTAQQNYYIAIENPTPAPTYLFTDGFESGCTGASCTGTTGATTTPYFPAWSSVNCGSGGYCPTVQNSVKHSGTYAYQQQYYICGASDGTCGGNSQDTNRWVGKVLSPMSHFFTRGYLYIKTPTIASELDDVVQRKLFRWSDSGSLPGTQYDFVLNSWTSSGGVVHPSYYSISFLSQNGNCPFTGTVNTNGTAVTWATGATFNTNTSQSNGSGTWAGGNFTINGVAYTIASVPTTTSLTLTTSAGVQSGALYTKTWVPFQAYDLINLNYDTWYSIEVEVQLNTPGLNDGVLKIWVDGVLTINKSTLNYRGYGCSNNVNFWGFGSQTNRYSFNPVDGLRYWDDLIINDTYIGP